LESAFLGLLPGFQKDLILLSAPQTERTEKRDGEISRAGMRDLYLSDLPAPEELLSLLLQYDSCLVCHVTVTQLPSTRHGHKEAS
jgi:hypothetical protein